MLFEFLKSLNYIKIEKSDADIDIPNWHKEVVRERLKNSKPEDYTSWNTIKKSIFIS